MSLSAHLLDTHEDRKPPAHLLHHPSANMTSYRSNMHNAGPSNGVTPGYAPPEAPKSPAEPWMSGHGMPWWMMAQPPSSRFTPWSEERVAGLQVRLARKLGPEYVTQRPGPGGGPKLSYIEGWKVIGLANEVFGFNGWSSSIVSLTTDFLDVNPDGRVSCHITAIIRITLQDGCFHEDVGGGQCENVKGKGSALDKAKKEAVTDGIKRALKTFGNVLGNCLYDKEYTKEIVKIKVPPAKFNANDLERRPEFTPAGAPAGNSNAQAAPPRPQPAAPAYAPPSRATTEPPRPDTPLKSIHEVALDTTMGEGYMDENFDAEFLDTEMTDESAMAPAPAFDGNQISSRADNFRRVDSAPAVPAYQHRHRPEMPPPAVNNTIARPVAGNGANDQQGDQTFSSGSSHTLSESTRPTTGNNDAAAAAARRRAAMQQVFADVKPSPSRSRLTRSATIATGPIRAQSPMIPSGGVDAVAARASQNFSTRAAQLDLEETNGAPFEGFSSARGMKRFSDEQVPEGELYDMHASPTKQSAPRTFQTSPLKALGEIGSQAAPRYVAPAGGGIHFGQKRHRAI